MFYIYFKTFENFFQNICQHEDVVNQNEYLQVLTI